jgi:biopolymer transport protein ExbD
MRIKRHIRRHARIEILPLIDVVFLLLVFFIYAMMSMAVHNGLQLDLPESSQASPSRESPLSLFIKVSDGEIDLYLNEQHISLAGLGSHLPSFVSQDNDAPEIMIFAEKQVTYQQLYQVLDVLNEAGIHDISLQANPE